MDEVIKVLTGFSMEFYIIIAVIFAFSMATLLVNLSTRKRVKRLEKKYKKFMDGLGSECNIEELLNSYMDIVKSVKEENCEIKNAINTIELNSTFHMQKLGIIRYNAFDNVGSDLSFAIALLDRNDDGFVLNGVYSRDSSCTYAKPIVKGKSKYILSAEEIQALDMAKKSVNR